MARGPRTGNLFKKRWHVSKTDFHETIKYSDIDLYLLTCSPLHDTLLSEKVSREECQEDIHVHLLIHKCRYLVRLPLSVCNKNKYIVV